MIAAAFADWLASAAMRELFGARATVQAMLDVEAALARAQAAHGVIADSEAAAIAAACDASRYDADALVADAARTGSLAIPLVRALTAAVARSDGAAADAVHRGATSQDVIDTALVLLLRRALALLDRDLGRLIAALLALARRHGDAPMLGRTLMQPAAVICFGAKVAAWTAPLLRGRERLHAAGSAAMQLQLGGAVGTRSMLAPDNETADAVARAMAAELRLADALPWHTQRDVLAALAGTVGVVAGSTAKIARDWSLMSQAEVGELHEGEAGGSSAMPHKRNPAAAMRAIAAAHGVPHRVAALLGAMAQEHERGLGNWQAEGAEWVALLDGAHAAIVALADAVPALVVDGERMRTNIQLTGGTVFAEAATALLAARVGKERARALLQSLSKRAVAERRELGDLLREAAVDDAALRIDDGVFDIDAAAAPVWTRAQSQLAELRTQAARLDASAPWNDFLPSDNQP